jgi:hypothetical protein
MQGRKTTLSLIAISALTYIAISAIDAIAARNKILAAPQSSLELAQQIADANSHFEFVTADTAPHLNAQFNNPNNTISICEIATVENAGVSGLAKLILHPILPEDHLQCRYSGTEIQLVYLLKNGNAPRANIPVIDLSEYESADGATKPDHKISKAR